MFMCGSGQNGAQNWSARKSRLLHLFETKDAQTIQIQLERRNHPNQQ